MLGPPRVAAAAASTLPFAAKTVESCQCLTRGYLQQHLATTPRRGNETADPGRPTLVGWGR